VRGLTRNGQECEIVSRKWGMFVRASAGSGAGLIWGQQEVAYASEAVGMNWS